MNEIDRDNFGRGISRRRLLQAMIAMGLFAGARGWAPAYARSAGLEPPANGPAAPAANELIVDKARLRIAGRTGAARHGRRARRELRGHPRGRDVYLSISAAAERHLLVSQSLGHAGTGGGVR